MPEANSTSEILDIFVIGGGINGCGIARDASGRGLNVMLAEMGDLGSATSSSSTKLLHGGLRYLEYFDFRLVREALIEREILLRAMPHIARPMRFVLPYHADMNFGADTPTSRLLRLVMPWMGGRRPAWLIRLGLFLYDFLGGRDILPAARTLELTGTPEGLPLQDRFERAFEYSDCWVDDARLVVLNARDATARGATILTRTEVTSAMREGDAWRIELRDTQSGATWVTKARALVNASGPWVGQILRTKVTGSSRDDVRLVRGSHIVARKLFDHDKSYFFQGEDGRIIFAIPYEQDFTLIGTTDVDHDDPENSPVATDAEQDYLCAFASSYFKSPVRREDIVWTYSGVRPLYDDGASSATAATRDYTVKLDATDGAPILNVFGGKITTYRRLAERAMTQLAPYFPEMSTDWTSGAALPGGDFPVDGVHDLRARLTSDYPFLPTPMASRLVRAYGTDAWNVLKDASELGDLGRSFGANLTEREIVWLMDNEYAYSADDVVWRRSKQGLRMTADEVNDLDQWMRVRGADRVSTAAE